MILAVCVDDKMGLQFNHRRQSRDSAAISDVLQSGETVWIHPFSEKLFDGKAVADEEYLAKAEPGHWCFWEDRSYLDYSHRIEKIVLYRWNRVYPRDMVFEFPGQWRLAEKTEFNGSSHETITREVYTK